jgi:hypothetical protein
MKLPTIGKHSNLKAAFWELKTEIQEVEHKNS